MYIKTDEYNRIIATSDIEMETQENEALLEYQDELPEITEEQLAQAYAALATDVLSPEMISDVSEVVQTYDGESFGVVAKFAPRLINARILAATEYLKDTDYQPTKNFELHVLGLPLEYDPKQLHADRQLRRDWINAYKSLL